MKKIKLLTPLLGLTALSGAVIPLASCSCKSQDTSKVLPTEQLVLVGNTLTGIKEGTDLTKYDTIYVPSTVRNIGENSLANLPANITTVKFAKEVRTFRKNVFVSSNTTNENSKVSILDFSEYGVDEIHALTFDSTSLGGLPFVGKIKFRDGITDVQKNALTKKLNEAGLPLGWFIDETTGNITVAEKVLTTENGTKAFSFELAKPEGIDYLECQLNVTSATEGVTITATASVEGKTMTVTMTKGGQELVNGDFSAFDVTFVGYKNHEAGTVAWIETVKDFKLTVAKEPTPEKVLQSIAVTTKPKTEYNVNEKFDAAGAVVTATYKQGEETTTEDVSTQTAYTCATHDLSQPFTAAGTYNIVATFQDKTDNFDVTVNSVSEWKHEWAGGKEYKNKVNKSTFEYVDPSTEFNDAYLSAVASNPEVLASDILSSFNRIYNKADRDNPYEIKCKVSNIVVHTEADSSCSLDFELEATANFYGYDSDDNPYPIEQSVSLAFKDVKLKVTTVDLEAYIESEYGKWFYQIDLENTSTNWSITGTMDKTINTTSFDQLSVDIGKDKTTDINKFKAYAYEDSVKNKPGYLIFNNIGSYNFTNVASVKYTITAPAAVEGISKVEFGNVYNTSKKVECTITPTDLTQLYYPQIDLCYTVDDGEPYDEYFASYKFDAFKGVIKFDIEFGEYFDNYVSYEAQHPGTPIKSNLILHQFKPIKYDDNLPANIVPASTNPKYAIIEPSEDTPWSWVGPLKFENTDAAAKDKKQKFNITGNIGAELEGLTGLAEKELGETTFEFDPLDNSYENPTVEDEVVISLTSEDVNIAKIDFTPVETTLSQEEYQGWNLTQDYDGNIKLKPYLEYSDDENGYWAIEFYVQTPDSAPASSERHNLKFTLSDGTNQWVRYARQGGFTSSSGIHFSFNQDEIDPSKTYTMSLAVEDYNCTNFDMDSAIAPEGVSWFGESQFLYKQDDGKLHITLLLQLDSPAEANITLSVKLTDGQNDYDVKQITIPQGEQEFEVSFETDWVQELNDAWIHPVATEV